ncbi:unnamed protein product, partial [Aphanomyces euteiches]
MGKKLWTDEEVHLLINHLSENVSTYTTGVKERFYASAKDCMERDGYTKSTIQIKTKLAELESSYKAYKLKLGRSGFGVKENDPP